MQRKWGLMGKALTGLIGELSACRIDPERRKLKWEPSVRYDCIDRDGHKYEIKTRRDSQGRKEVNPRGTIGRYGKRDKYIFDVGLYVELSTDYEVTRIYKMSIDLVSKLEAQSKRKDKCITVGNFRAKAKLIYPRRSE